MFLVLKDEMFGVGNALHDLDVVRRGDIVQFIEHDGLHRLMIVDVGVVAALVA